MLSVFFSCVEGLLERLLEVGRKTDAYPHFANSRFIFVTLILCRITLLSQVEQNGFKRRKLKESIRIQFAEDATPQA